jgi:hypothetical protein
MVYLLDVERIIDLLVGSPGVQRFLQIIFDTRSRLKGRISSRMRMLAQIGESHRPSRGLASCQSRL